MPETVAMAEVKFLHGTEVVSMCKRIPLIFQREEANEICVTFDPPDGPLG